MVTKRPVKNVNNSTNRITLKTCVPISRTVGKLQYMRMMKYDSAVKCEMSKLQLTCNNMDEPYTHNAE